MPSFTSNSERSLRVLVAAVVLALALAAGWDLGWRRRGFAPGAVDDVNLWSVWRDRADRDAGVLALAGSSRLLMGLDLPTLRARFPARRIVQLSLNGGSPLAVLQNLADDANFSGLVLCEVLPHQAYTNPRWGEVWPGYDNLPWSQRIEAPLHVYLAGKTNLLRPEISLLNVVREVTRYRRLPRPGFLHVGADRQGGMDFSGVTSADLTAMREKAREAYGAEGTALYGADFGRRIAEVRGLAEKIQRRGGSVVFLRMISSSPVREVQAARFPDAAYWDVFRRQVGFPCVNYADYPALTAFTCPEGAHLDQADAPAFTAALSEVLSGEKLLR